MPGALDALLELGVAPEGWRPEAPFHFVDGVEPAMAKAQEFAGDRTVEVAAGDVGGQVLAAGLVGCADDRPERIREVLAVPAGFDATFFA